MKSQNLHESKCTQNTQYKKAHIILGKNPNPMFSVVYLFYPVIYTCVCVNKFSCAYKVAYKSLNTGG